MSDLERKASTPNKAVANKHGKFAFEIQVTKASRWATVEKREGKPLLTLNGLEVEGYFVARAGGRSDIITITPDGRNLWEVPVWGKITFDTPEQDGSASTHLTWTMNCFMVRGSDNDNLAYPDRAEFFLFLPDTVEKMFCEAGSLPTLTLTVYGLTKVRDADGSGVGEYEWHREKARHIVITQCHLRDPKGISA